MTSSANGIDLAEWEYLVLSVARRVNSLENSTLLEEEDLAQEGRLALLGVHLDPAYDRGQVRAYIAQRIRGAMLDAIRKYAFLPRTEVLRRKEAQIPLQRFHSLSEPLRASDNGSVELEDLLASDDPTADDRLIHADISRRLGLAVANLPWQESAVITLYYYEDMTLKDIGKVFGVSESRASQIKTKALNRLAEQFRRDDVDMSIFATVPEAEGVMGQGLTL